MRDASKARLDEDGTAKPKTEIVGVFYDNAEALMVRDLKLESRPSEAWDTIWVEKPDHKLPPYDARCSCEWAAPKVIHTIDGKCAVHGVHARMILGVDLRANEATCGDTIEAAMREHLYAIKANDAVREVRAMARVVAFVPALCREVAMLREQRTQEASCEGCERLGKQLSDIADRCRKESGPLDLNPRWTEGMNSVELRKWILDASTDTLMRLIADRDTLRSALADATLKNAQRNHARGDAGCWERTKDEVEE